MIGPEDLKPGSKFQGLFHKAWGQAKASPEYDKEVWKRLEEMLHSRPDPDEHPKVRSEAYASMSPREQWAHDKRAGTLDD
jgi:hypothetical protein